MPVTARAWKAVILFSLTIGFLWVIFGGLARGFASREVLFNGIVGMLLGAMAGPKLANEGFVLPKIWQVAFATAGCLLFAVSARASPLGLVFALLAGAFLGYTADHWLRYASP
jgi:hypothetical protein